MAPSNIGIVIEGTLRKCQKFRIFQTKWVERHFVLYCWDEARGLYSFNEYKSLKKKELKKTLNSQNINKIEANLTLSDPTLSCSSSSSCLDHIFTIGFKSHGHQKEIYLLADSDEEMNRWVRHLCKACRMQVNYDANPISRLENMEVEFHRLPSSSVAGMSISSQSLNGYNESNTDDGKSYLRLQNYSSNSVGNFHNTNLSDDIYENTFVKKPDGTESCSDLSSMYSHSNPKLKANGEEGDSSSMASGPPVPPPRNRYQKAKIDHQPIFSKRAVVSKLSKTPIMDRREMSTVVSENELESSGETIVKQEIVRNAPPPIDRSNKPRSMKIDDNKASHYKNFGGGKKYDDLSSHRYAFSRTMTAETTVKRRNIDYFEPAIMEIVNTSTRSPTPSDVEYITVDVDRTMAFKQMRQE